MTIIGLLTAVKPEPWVERAICSRTSAEFFPERGGSSRDAKIVCLGCPVRRECLAYAMSHDERFGVWGGLAEHERRALRRGERVTFRLQCANGHDLTQVAAHRGCQQCARDHYERDLRRRRGRRTLTGMAASARVRESLKGGTQ